MKHHAPSWIQTFHEGIRYSGRSSMRWRIWWKKCLQKRRPFTNVRSRTINHQKQNSYKSKKFPSNRLKKTSYSLNSQNHWKPKRQPSSSGWKKSLKSGKRNWSRNTRESRNIIFVGWKSLKKMKNAWAVKTKGWESKSRDWLLKRKERPMNKRKSAWQNWKNGRKNSRENKKSLTNMRKKMMLKKRVSWKN